MNKMKKHFKVANEILELIPASNIVSHTHCMTRLRLVVKDPTIIDLKALESLEDALGLKHSGNNIQIVLGPGFVDEVYDDFVKLLSDNSKSSSNQAELNGQQEVGQIAFETKNKFREKNKAVVMNFFNKVSQIFAPFIAVFIAAGLLQAIGTIITVSYTGKVIPTAALQWRSLLGIAFSIVLQLLPIIVGWKTAEVYGGSPIIGALLGAMYAPLFGTFMGGLYSGDYIVGGEGGYFLGIPVKDIGKNWFTVGIFSVDLDNEMTKKWVASGLHGSIFGALIISALGAQVEKLFNRFIPNTLKIFLVPFMVVSLMFVAQFLLIIPLSGYLFSGLSWVFEFITKSKWAMPIFGTFLAGIWLWAVVFGVHQGVTPIYVMLIQTQGINPLFPILAMAGASQVGASVALYLRAKSGTKVRRQILSTIFPGILGIGEPMIYGVTLPRIKPFITACIGAAFGGLFFGLLSVFGITIGVTALGGSGLMALPLIGIFGAPYWSGYLIYLLGLLFTYSMGFVFTYFFGWKGVDLT